MHWSDAFMLTELSYRYIIENKAQEQKRHTVASIITFRARKIINVQTTIQRECIFK